MGELSRVTGLSPTLKDARGITTVTMNNDPNLMMFLQEGEEHGVYLYNMGEIDDLERSNYILDKDTQMVYDSRKELDMLRLDKRVSGPLNTTVPHMMSEASYTTNKPKRKSKPWANFWKNKRENNEKYLLAAEMGDLKQV